MDHDAIDSDDDDSVQDTQDPPQGGQGRSKWVIAGALLIAVGAIGLYVWQANEHDKELKKLRSQLKSVQLQPPGSVQTYRLKPSASLPAAPTLQLGHPNPPQLLDLYLDVSDSPYNTFQITIDKKGEARVLQMRRVARDSNKEIRLSWNSSAFGPGEYQFRLEGYDWRGNLTGAGWLSIGTE